MKKIVLAFDSFKGSLTADEACQAAAESLKRRFPNSSIIKTPMSDGGEGLVKCVYSRIPSSIIEVKAHGPLMEQISAHYALSSDGKTAYMEMAETSGLTLVPIEKRNPLLTTTYGVGELILDAIHRGCQHIIMGIGGSATCDAGKGMIDCLEANGFNFSSSSLPNITVACDVNNPLFGKNGASYIFSPQKGASPKQVIELDKRLRQFAKETENKGFATSSLAEYPGTGAAGGLGYGLMAYLNAELKSGIDTLLDITNFDTILADADMVITGEGKSDIQTLMGKVPYGILQRAKAHSIPVHIISGKIESAEELINAGFASCTSINEKEKRPLSKLMKKEIAYENLYNCVSRKTF